MEQPAPASPTAAAAVPVTFVIMPEGVTMDNTFDPMCTVDDLKHAVETEMPAAAAIVKFTLAGQSPPDNATLAQLGGSGMQPLQFELLVEQVSDEGGSGDVLDVEIDDGPDLPPRVIRVTIQRRDDHQKPYLGGYRHKQTEKLYHHASAQTEITPATALAMERKRKTANQLTRETQTYQVQSRTLQTVRDSCTQMARPGIYVDDTVDAEVAPLPYFDSVSLDALRLEKTIVIQSFARGMFARTRARDRRAMLREQALQLQLAEQQRRQEEAAFKESEMARRYNPQTAEDFAILYAELEAWRLSETEKIDASGSNGMERHAELAKLLHRETHLLQTIDQLKLKANKENGVKKITDQLADMSQPKEWAMSDGQVAQVETPFTVRAKELADLYRGLNLTNLSIDERLDVLLHVKWTVKEFDCGLSRDMVDLIDREADMLNRGRSESSLEGLRKRTSNLFLQFIQTPQFNPESSRFLTVPPELLVKKNVQAIRMDRFPHADNGLNPQLV